MSRASVAESPGPVHICSACRRYQATLQAPATLLEPGKLLCEACAEPGQLWRHCEPVGPDPDRRPRVLVDVEFLELVSPLLGAVELRLYLAAIQLCDGLRSLSSLAKLARAAGLSKRNAVDAFALLERVGLLVRAGSYGPRGTRFLVVRPAQVGSEPDRPTLIRPAVYSEAREALSVIRGSPVRPVGSVIQGSPVDGLSVICDLRTGDLGITDIGDQGSPVVSSIDPRGIQHTNQPAGGSPTHPPSGGPAPPAPGSWVEQAADAAAAAWPTYARRVLRDRARLLAGWAEQDGRSATAAQIGRFLVHGAAQAWLKRDAERGRISSPLHVWCDRQRWIRWLDGNRRAAARAAEQKRAAEVRELPQAERRNLALQALADLEHATRRKVQA